MSSQQKEVRDGVPHTPDGRPYAIRLQRTAAGTVHPRTGLPSLVVRVFCPLLVSDYRLLRRLRFFPHERSGAAAEGGPGHRVRADWVMPLARFEAQTPSAAVLRAEVALLLARVNPSTLPGDRTGQRAIEAAQAALADARAAVEAAQ